MTKATGRTCVIRVGASVGGAGFVRGVLGSFGLAGGMLKVEMPGQAGLQPSIGDRYLGQIPYPSSDGGWCPMSWQRWSRVTDLSDAGPAPARDRRTFSGADSANEMYRVCVGRSEEYERKEGGAEHVREVH
jgi:hypothetical protein